ncbi:MAG: hypothetical protein LBR76_02255 [Oscillospiraceae bacterium]|nr:hypothetical protein [Oscillospiraceae bacterium]
MTRYFIYNHQAAFQRCLLSGAESSGDRIVLENAGEGLLVTPVMDSQERGNLWQRVAVSAELPEGASVVWQVIATDSEHAAQGVRESWGGGSLSFAQITENRKERIESRRFHGVDFLLTGVRGRYCVAAAALNRPEGAPPVVVTSVQVFSAWESFLPYLPEIYREEGSFLDRFLRLFSAPYLELEQAIERLSLDPRAASPEMLRWLAGTMGIPHIGLWRAENLRALLISGLYRKKGRFSALADFTEVYTGFRPYVCENFRMINGDAEHDRHFRYGDISLFLPPEASETEWGAPGLRAVLGSFLPAGVSCSARILDKVPALGGESFLGMNTRLGEAAPAELGVNSRLNFAKLGDSHDGEREPISALPQ